MAEAGGRSVRNAPDSPAGGQPRDDAALGVADVMARLSLTRAQVYRLVKDGVLKAGKPDAQLQFSDGDVAAAAEKLAERRKYVDALLHLLTAKLAEHGIDDLADDIPEDTDAALGEAANRLLLASMAAGAGDVYVLPNGGGIRVLARYESGLQEVARVDGDVGNRLKEKLKALAPLPAAEAGQDCAAIFKHTGGDLTAQVRLSVIETLAGEHLHLRFFYSDAARTFESIGFTARQDAVLRGVLSGKPGLFVLAGSDERTMQPQRQALAHHLAALDKLVVAIDRVPNYLSENVVHLDGRQTDEADGADLWQTAIGLCPDAILLDWVAEITPLGTLTAALAAGITVIVQAPAATCAAALEHLVALGVGRLDLARYLAGASESVVMPMLCSACRTPRSVTPADAELLRLPAGAQVYAAVGCEQCENGFNGRRVVWGLVTGKEAEGLVAHAGDAVPRAAASNPPQVADSAPPTAAHGDPYRSDTSLASALRETVLAGVVTSEHAARHLRFVDAPMRTAGQT